MNKKIKFLNLVSGLVLMSISLAVSATPEAYQMEVIIFSHITAENLQSETWSETPNTPANGETTKSNLVPSSQWVLQNEGVQLSRNHYTILLHSAWKVSTDNARKGQLYHLYGGKIDDNTWQVSGTLALNLQRYFDAHFNLQFYNPTNNTSYKVNQIQRMKSNELNYIDHPLYGILIKIVPLN